MLFVTVGSLVSSMAFAKPVVAVIEAGTDRVEISLERLNLYLKENPSLAPKIALNQIIEFELIAAQAREAGLQNSPSVEIATAKTMVGLYLKQAFEPLWSKENIPDELLRTSYTRNRRIFNHPELRKAVHVIVTKESKFPEDPALAEAAKTIADRVFAHYSASPPKDMEEFQRRAKTMKTWGEDVGLQVELQDLNRFAKRGRYSSNFTEPVFAVSGEKVVMPVFKTEFGYHIVWIEAVTPARSDSFEVVREEILDKITPEVRSMKLIALTDQLSEQYPPINRGVGARRLMNARPLVALEFGEEE